MPLKPSEPPHLWPSTSADAGHGLAAVVAHALDQLVHAPAHPLHFVEHVLRVEEANTAAVHVPRFGEQRVELVVLAAQPEHEHPAGVRMTHQSREHLTRMSEVVAELAAAVRMRERVHAVDRPGEALVRRSGDLLRRPVHAADGVDDPHLVARADAAVGALESLPRRGVGAGALARGVGS